MAILVDCIIWSLLGHISHISVYSLAMMYSEQNRPMKKLSLMRLHLLAIRSSCMTVDQDSASHSRDLGPLWGP